jgi:hypothetical protein
MPQNEDIYWFQRTNEQLNCGAGPVNNSWQGLKGAKKAGVDVEEGGDPCGRLCWHHGADFQILTFWN